MLNSRISESEGASPADLNGAVPKNLRGNKAAHQPDFHFIVEDQALEQCSFEQLGLIAFDPDQLDWWSENESDLVQAIAQNHCSAKPL